MEYRKNSKKTEEHAYKKIDKEIKNNSLKSPLFFYGSEHYLIQWAINSIIETYVAEAATDLDLSRLDAANLKPDELIGYCETLPMISSKRVVIVENFALLAGKKMKNFSELSENQLTEYIKNIPDNCLLIFTEEKADKRRKLYKAISSAGACYEFKTLDEKTLTGFIQKRLKESSKQIKPSLIREMIDLTGYYDKETDYTLYNLNNDLQKIVALSEGIEVRREDIVDAVTGNSEAYVFDMIDAVANGNKGEAFLLINDLLRSGDSVYKLLALICSQFEIMLMAKEMAVDGYSYDSIRKELSIHDYRLKKAVYQGSKYSVSKLRSILMSAYQVDKNIKKGLLDERLALEMLIAEM